jgi:nicotinamidase-related amidase
MKSGKALIVIDMLNDFCHEEGVLSKTADGTLYAADIIDPVRHLVNTYRNSKTPIIWICDSHEEDDKEFDRFPKHAVVETWGADIIDELEPSRIGRKYEAVIKKTRYSGFFRTSLGYLLSRAKINDCIIVGVCTSICVMDTVAGLANRDLKATVHKNAVADFDPEAHEFALKRMKNLYGVNII